MNKVLIILIILGLSSNVLALTIAGSCAKILKTKKFLKIHNKYANGFSIKRYKGFYLLTLKKHWDSQKDQYIFLVQNDLFFPSSCHKYFKVKLPVKNVAVLSTAYVPALEMIDELKSIKSFKNLKYVYSPVLKEAEQNGEIFELGDPPSAERLLAVRPNVIFSYVTADPKIEGIRNLTNLKLPVVFISEFKEVHPLARAEWVKVFGLFYNKLAMANTKFNEIEKSYNETTSIALKAPVKRKVIIGELSGGIWHGPNVKSDLVRLLQDAGGRYIWSQEKQTAGLSINIEKVLIDGDEAEVWLPQSINNTLKDFKSNKNYESLKFLKKIKAYNNNNRLSVGGGNDYWETALMRPDLLLKDLLKILHPSLLIGHDLIWYKELEDN